MPPRYRLKLQRLDFVSPVDTPAQETAKVLLLKRGGTVARVVKTSDELGLVFCWAFTSTDAAGKPYHDLQGDAIDQDFVKAAADFMLDGGHTDEMHDGKNDGRVVFAMPMTPEIAKSFGVVSKTTGLMVALKPSPEVYAKFKSGAYTGVSIAGLGEREVVKRAEPVLFARVCKEAVLTSEEAGHAHTIDLDDPSRYWCDQLQTSYQTAEGATTGHSHAWVFDAATGAITIAPDSGHTHTIDAVVPADVLVAYAARDAQRDAANLAAPLAVEDAICAPVTDEESSGKVSVVVVQARAPANKSTQAITAKHGDDMKLVILTEAQHAHYSKLAAADAEAFIAKSSQERDVVLADIAKNDPVVFKGELTGFEVRKSQGDFALKMAQSAEKAEKRAADAAAREALEKSAKESEILKAAVKADIPHLAGADGVKESLYKAAQAIEGGVALLKAADDAMKSRGVAKGHASGDPVATSAQADLDAAVAKYAVEKNVPIEKAYAAVLDTPDGRRLYGEIQKSKNKG